MLNINGTGVALVTPFLSDGQLDYQSLERLIDYVIKGGVEYLVLMGTTGESPVLSADEKRNVIQTAIQTNAKRCPMVIGIGGNDTQAIVNAFYNQAHLDHFEAILSVSPYYNRPSQHGLYQHYQTLAQNAPLPIILYNVPARTGRSLDRDTVLSLGRDFENIIGIKEASDNLTLAVHLIKDSVQFKNFYVVSGDDNLAVPMTLVGGHGVISVLAQAFPSSSSQMIRQALNKEAADVLPVYHEFMNWIPLAFKEGNPVGIKAILHQMGIIKTPFVRLPLVPASAPLTKNIRTALDQTALS